VIEFSIASCFVSIALIATTILAWRLSKLSDSVYEKRQEIARRMDESLRRIRELTEQENKEVAAKKAKRKRRLHWFRCQKCGQNSAHRVNSPPRERCKICKDEAIDYHYLGFVVNPYEPALDAEPEPPRPPRQIVMEKNELP
jgi:predicted Zn-ribbon and HTH transcriptional regulator